MDLLAPLQEIASEVLEEEKLDTRIPIPSPEYLKKLNPKVEESHGSKLVKYKKEYEEFCRWSALPKEQRKPKTAKEFEKKYYLPNTYTNYFRAREDFNDKRLNYFWEWMIDLYPDVVHAIYKRAVDKGGSKDAQVFIELLAKKMKLDQPKMQVQPMVLMGVAQEKIDALFTPKGYGEGVIPGQVIPIKEQKKQTK